MIPKAIRSILALVFVFGLVLIGVPDISLAQPPRPPSAAIEDERPTASALPALASESVAPDRVAATLTVDGACTDADSDLICDSPAISTYKTIQKAIDMATAGDTINVLAGTYIENVIVNKALTLVGAGAGSTIVQPAVSAPNPCTGSSLCGGAASNVFLIEASDVLIHDLTVDGDNPSLTSGIVRGGADLDARNGIIKNTNTTYNNLEVYNVTAQNIYLRGIYSTGGSFNFHNNTVTNVRGDEYSIAMFAWGGPGTMASNTVSYANDGISANHSSGIQFLNNTVTHSGSGIHTDNSGDAGGVADLIQGNNVNCTDEADAYGVWVFVPYLAPTVNNNTVTNCAVGLSAWGQGAAVTTSFTNNVVNGAAGSTGVYITTDLISWGYTDVSVNFSGNVIAGNTDGIYFTADDQSWNPGSYVAKKITAVFSDNSITGNTTQLGVDPDDTDGIYNIDASGNWWDDADPADVKIAANGGVLVDYTPWLASGTDISTDPGFQGDFSTLWVDDDSPQTGSTGRIQEGINLVSGSTVEVAAGTYVENINILASLTLKGAQYGVGVSGRTAADASESTIQGLVTVDASNVVVDGFTLTNPGQTYALYVKNHSPSHSVIAITHNIVDTVGATGLGSNVHAILLNQGPDSVTIAHNRFNNIKANTKSASAVGVLDSASTDPSEALVIEDNTFTDIASTTKGAYGIIINNAAGAPGAMIKTNSFSGLSGGWTHAIGLEGPTPSAVVSGNTFSALTAAGADNVAVHFEKNSGGATVTVSGNQFNGGGYYGVALNPNDMAGGPNGLCYTVNAENNWWNSADGPTGSGAALAGPQVDYSPWWTDAAGTGTASVSGGSSLAFVIPAGSSTATQQAILDCAVPDSTVTFATNASPYVGGIAVNTNALTLILNGNTFGPGSSWLTVNADDLTALGPATIDGDSDTNSAIVVNGGADNFTLKDAEVREWADGVEVAGSVASLKIVGNWIHDNTGAGLKIASGVAVGGVVNIEGNLFKDNGGNGIQNDGTTDPLKAEYNSWGHLSGPASGDGVSAKVDAEPFTFTELFIDVDPDTEAVERHVVETTSFDVKLVADAAKLSGLTFKVTYDTSRLQLNSTTFAGVWGGTTCTSLSTTPGEIAYRCQLFAPAAEWDADGGMIATLNFTALAGPTGPGPWTTYFDVAHAQADTSAGAVGGVKIYVNNAGYGAPSIAARDITDTDDGKIIIDGLANYTGYVDLQSRTNENGAVLKVYNQQAKSGAILLAQGSSAAGGGYTTAYEAGKQLIINTTYWLVIDRDLYLPTTAMATTPSHTTIPTDWQHSKLLDTRPLTGLGTVVLLGGDATNNDAIDINDATCIGGDYAKTSGFTACGAPLTTGGTSDVNGDGVVNILDLSLMGGNFYENSSPWTP